MTFIRIAIAILLLVPFTACDVLEPDEEESSETPAAAPTSFELQGSLSTQYTLSDVHTCEDVLLADLPPPQTGEEVNAKILHQEAQSQIELVMERSVTIKDAEEDEHLATVETADELTTAELEDGEADEGEIGCVASTSFSTVVPPVDNYLFVVRGLAGTPEPVAYEDLEAAGFGCDILIDADGQLARNATCGV